MSFFKNINQKKAAAAGVGLAACGLFLYQQNNKLATTEITIASEKLPPQFKGYRMVHLSDLHQKLFGEKQTHLVDEVKKAEPDVILFTGDLIDARKSGMEPSLVLMAKLVEVAPVYYVTGNHEGKMTGLTSLIEKLEKLNVNVMQTKSEKIDIGEESIYILGVDDPEVTEGEVEGEELENAAEKAIQEVIGHVEKDSFKILLSHRPELFSLYTELGIDLTLSGHAHGGQIRLPLIGGLFAPGQGFFPKYITGEYSSNHEHMIVSRGLGPTIFPTRLFNRPEVIVINLKPQYRSKDI